MADMHPDVSFPLYGGGSTPALTDRLRLRLLHFGGTTVDAGWGHADFTAPHWRAYLNLDDGMVVRWPGSAEPLRAGHLYAIPAWLPWAGRCRGRVRHLNASIELPSLPRERVAARCPRIFHLGGPGSPLTDGWLRLGLELAAAEHPDDVRTARGYALAYGTVAAVLAQLGPEEAGLAAAPGETRLEEVVGWIERNLGLAMRVADLAREGRCSRAELVRRFRSIYGTSPARWVRQRRIAVAADLLRCTDESVDVIAERCGFSDRSRFSKAFTALIGRGPGAWRRLERRR